MSTLEKTVRVVSKLGFVGEDSLVRLLYLTCVSALGKDPVRVLVHGHSGGGKSLAIRVVTQLIPAEIRRVLGRKGAGGNPTYPSVVIAENLAVASISGLPPREAAFIGTSCLANPDPNEIPGVLAVPTTETPELTANVLEFQKLSATAGGLTGLRRASDEAAEIAKQFEKLKSVEVVIPFAKEIKYPAKNLRARSDFPQFLALIKAHALLEQGNRRVKGQFVEASFEDYAVAYGIFVELLSDLYCQVTPREAMLLGYIRILSGSDPNSWRPFTVTQLVRKTYLSRTAVEEYRLKPLEAKGYVRKIPGKHRPFRYVLNRDPRSASVLAKMLLRPDDLK